ncbi:metallophosphoesterase family protein [Hansschlegelia zhihuaiae]|uniref:Metallophosphoesterase n=1 Tax=Hansschlegelia zhihuaiae TaxID=405005 RepID=A0A4Q0MM96_9HYPH|nr:metallophosphoesterase [Hansschlegelia zhihuaiae]RXF74947.1 metallophosphoesterase [Hansschlegelia zhihuaiae]
MADLIDPRRGDIEDDASSTKLWSIASLAGWVLVEISLPKLLLSWLLLIGLPCALLGAAPLVVTAWWSTTSRSAAEALGGLLPLLVLAGLITLALVGARPAFRLAEQSFWSLNALAVQPSFVLCREGLRHFVGRRLSLYFRRDGARVGRVTALAAAVLMSLASGAAAYLAWPHSRWIGSWADLIAPASLIVAALANSVVLFGVYVAFASLVWGTADAAMDQPVGLDRHDPEPGGKVWRVAHLSDLHTIGERFGFRIESGRSGPQGNERVAQTLAALARVDAEERLDLVLFTGDMTDAGRSAEWAEFVEALDRFPGLRDRALLLPGNHDVNVVDRANPARLDLPFSPGKRLRRLRTLALLAKLQGERVHIGGSSKRDQASLSAWLAPHASAVRTFIRTGRGKRAADIRSLWDEAFPMTLDPDGPDGLGVVLLNSNADTHFSFTNALGLMPAEQERRLAAIMRARPDACWIVALHHHLLEYPRPTRSLSERIGTALINGSWFLRQLKPNAHRLIVMHGHRHVDWTGRCGGLRIVSAPSPVMGEPYFYIQRLAVKDGRLALLKPQRVDLPEQGARSAAPIEQPELAVV